MAEQKLPDTKTCPKCKGAMDKGRIIPAIAWVKGNPMFALPAFKLVNTVWTYKCSKCGCLEYYDEVKA